MSLVTLFARRLPPPCWLRAYQTTSVRLCNPKGATAPPEPLGSEPKEPVTEQSQKPLKEDKKNIQNETVKPMEATEPAKSTPAIDIPPLPPMPATPVMPESLKPIIESTPAAVEAPVNAKEETPEQSKGTLSTSAPQENTPSIISAITGLRHAPPPALGLGLAGLIPFMAAPAYMYNAGVFLPSIATAQLTYGATILSFLGGVRWGLLASGSPLLPPTWSQYSWSVTPSLVAWVALLIPNQPAATTLCVAGLTTALVLDMKQQGYPDWFRGLRLILTLGALLSLLCSLGLSMGIGIKPLQSTLLT